MLKHIKAQPDWNEKSLGAKGFTLIELLVVIIILGILAAVVIFAVSGIQNRGQSSACRTDLRTMKTAVEAYYAQHGEYPNDEAKLVSTGFLEETSSLYNYSGGSGQTRGTFTGVSPC